MTDLLYNLTDISRSYNQREVLNIPKLELEKGKIYGLLGPNGAGKTTLMRILSFMDTPTTGQIEFMGNEIRPEHAFRCRPRVVWVPQFPVLFTGSLLYNVEYPMRLKHIPRKVRNEKAMELLDRIGLSHLATAPARRLSGGEAQRASIARALAAGAEVLLFDEPTANVDFRSRHEIINLILHLWKEDNISIIVTTHDQPLADSLCHEQITLFDGKVSSWTQHKKLKNEKGYGTTSLPAKLVESSTGIEVAVSIPLAAIDSTERNIARLDAMIYALSLGKAGVTMSLHLPSDKVVDILLASSTDQETAKNLHIGSGITVVYQAD